MKPDTLPESAGRPSRTRSPRSRSVQVIAAPARSILHIEIRSGSMPRSEADTRCAGITGLANLILSDTRLAGVTFTCRTIPAGGAA